MSKRKFSSELTHSIYWIHVLDLFTFIERDLVSCLSLANGGGGKLKECPNLDPELTNSLISYRK
jgi:hypothetical protein